MLPLDFLCCFWGGIVHITFILVIGLYVIWGFRSTHKLSKFLHYHNYVVMMKWFFRVFNAKQATCSSCNKKQVFQHLQISWKVEKCLNHPFWYKIHWLERCYIGNSSVVTYTKLDLPQLFLRIEP